MSKTLVFLVEGISDLSNHVNNLKSAIDLIQGDLDCWKGEEEEMEYTITPVWMTDEEWEALPQE